MYHPYSILRISFNLGMYIVHYNCPPSLSVTYSVSLLVFSPLPLQCFSLGLFSSAFLMSLTLSVPYQSERNSLIKNLWSYFDFIWVKIFKCVILYIHLKYIYIILLYHYSETKWEIMQNKHCTTFMPWNKLFYYILPHDIKT